MAENTETKNKEECIFCKIVKGDVPSKKIYENENFFSIYDINPSFEGHALVVSKGHFKTILDMPVSLGQEFIDAVKNTSIMLTKKFSAEGFNVVGNVNEVAGQIVDHFHVHIIPRKKEDNAKLDYVDKYTGKSVSLTSEDKQK